MSCLSSSLSVPWSFRQSINQPSTFDTLDRCPLLYSSRWTSSTLPSPCLPNLNLLTYVHTIHPYHTIPLPPNLTCERTIKSTCPFLASTRRCQRVPDIGNYVGAPVLRFFGNDPQPLRRNLCIKKLPDNNSPPSSFWVDQPKGGIHILPFSLAAVCSLSSWFAPYLLLINHYCPVLYVHISITNATARTPSCVESTRRRTSPS